MDNTDLKEDLSVFCGASAKETNFVHQLGFALPD